MNLGVYECSKVIFPKDIVGDLILATPEHKDIVLEYIKRFNEDCFPNSPRSNEEIEKLRDNHLANQSIYLLKTQSGEMVSMAANVRSTINGATISLVYSPPSLRGKGYASCVVALLTDKLLHDGKKFANLFTDLTKPISNGIYQKIGQNIHYDFI